MDKKLFTILHSKIVFIWTYENIVFTLDLSTHKYPY